MRVSLLGTSVMVRRPDASLLQSTRTARRARTLPLPSSTNSFVLMHQSRQSPPSASLWLDEVRRTKSHCGQGFLQGAVRGRLGEQFNVEHGLGTLAQRRSDTVGTGIAAADNHNALVRCRDFRAFDPSLPSRRRVCCVMKVHGGVDAVKIRAGNVHPLEGAGLGRADGDNDGIVLVQFRRGHIAADFAPEAELDALGAHSARPGGGPRSCQA